MLKGSLSFFLHLMFFTYSKRFLAEVECKNSEIVVTNIQQIAMCKKIDLNALAYVAVTSENSAFANFFIAATRLHLCTERLFAETPYKIDKFPEIWFHQVELVKPYISEETYLVLLDNKNDSLKGHTLQHHFIEKLENYDREFEAELSRMFQAIEDLRTYIPVKRKEGLYKPSDVSSHFEKKLIIRPRHLPFEEYDYGVGLMSPDDSPKKANKNGRDTNRVQYMTTELVLMICILMNLPRVEVFLALYPYKWKNLLTSEWDTLRLLGKSYYYTLHRYATMESIYDDLLLLLGCYEIYSTLGPIKPDSEKLILFLSSVARKALKHRRYWERVKSFLGDDHEEAMLSFVLARFLTPRLKTSARLQTIFLRDLQAIDTAKFDEIEKLSAIQFSGPCGYPKLI